MSLIARERRRTSWARAGLLLGLAAALGVASPASAAGKLGVDLQKMGKSAPDATVETIVQFDADTTLEEAQADVRAAGLTPGATIPLIHGIAVEMPAKHAKQLAAKAGVRVISLNAKVKPQGGVDVSHLANAYDASVAADRLWNGPHLTGKGVGVAVIDSGIEGDLPDFGTSQTDPTSRVVETAVTNPYATTAGDPYGHGTHVAGIIAGNSLNRAKNDASYGKYIGVAPDANLISIKAGDDQGNATVLDVIYGLQFAVEHQADYNIRVVNLSLESASAQSYMTDPLDAAVEAAWKSGLVVVAAAGNRGTAADAVSYAPGNDPYVISVGAVDDKGTKAQTDDVPASWSSRGTTQDGLAKPDVVAPGAHIVSTLAAGSAFTQLCASCVVGGQYIRAGGTSMAAPVVAGLAADLLQGHPSWTPDQVKGALLTTARPLTGGLATLKEIVGDKANGAKATANQGLTPSTLVSGTGGTVDYTRSSWSRSSWSTAPSGLTAGWARSSWSCTCSLTSSGSIDPTRSSWSTSTWSTSWTL